ncbi:MAG: hypothetical protein HYX76_09115 [Acidobacteria bacterium]|nr:hypothetical protein [Acidobacteriota bacterium]
MRDLIAALIALLLLLVALGLAVALERYRWLRARAREAERARGRRIVAEVPRDPDLVLFSEDATQFHYGSREIDKSRIRAVRVLINGAPIAGFVSPRFPEAADAPATSFEDHPDGIARDRWDVAIETVKETVLVECGAIRERVSQELARSVYDAVRRAMEEQGR